MNTLTKGLLGVVFAAVLPAALIGCSADAQDPSQAEATTAEEALTPDQEKPFYGTWLFLEGSSAKHSAEVLILGKRRGEDRPFFLRRRECDAKTGKCDVFEQRGQYSFLSTSDCPAFCTTHHLIHLEPNKETLKNDGNTYGAVDYTYALFGSRLRLGKYNDSLGAIGSEVPEHFVMKKHDGDWCDSADAQYQCGIQDLIPARCSADFSCHNHSCKQSNLVCGK